ncbi:MAG: YHS domain-containing protein [Planctomycetes bacterium]|nr:YHS domain-containing protein [Planctomycetota bacterium]
MKIRIAIIASFLVVLFLSIIHADTINSMNPLCPVLTDEASSPRFKLTHDGKTVYFCCQKCLDRFTEAPEEYAKNIQYPVNGERGQDESQKSSGSSPPEVDRGTNEHSDHFHDENHQKHGNHPGRAQVLFSKMHPVLVHFPIAGILFVFMLQMAQFIFREKDLKFSITIMLGITALSVIPTVASGWMNASLQNFSESRLAVFEVHRILAIATMVSTVLSFASQVLCRSTRVWAEKSYFFFLVTSVILASLAGHWGGMLVYGVKYFNV